MGRGDGGTAAGGSGFKCNKILSSALTREPSLMLFELKFMRFDSGGETALSLSLPSQIFLFMAMAIKYVQNGM